MNNKYEYSYNIKLLYSIIKYKHILILFSTYKNILISIKN